MSHICCARDYPSLNDCRVYPWSVSIELNYRRQYESKFEYVLFTKLVWFSSLQLSSIQNSHLSSFSASANIPSDFLELTNGLLFMGTLVVVVTQFRINLRSQLIHCLFSSTIWFSFMYLLKIMFNSYTLTAHFQAWLNWQSDTQSSCPLIISYN